MIVLAPVNDKPPAPHSRPVVALLDFIPPTVRLSGHLDGDSGVDMRSVVRMAHHLDDHTESQLMNTEASTMDSSLIPILCLRLQCHRLNHRRAGLCVSA